MAEQWELKITELQGRTFLVTVYNPMEATVASIKERISQKHPDLPAFLQRLIHTNGRSKKVLEDTHSLSSCSGLVDGSTLHLLCLVPFELYIHDLDGKLNKFTIPSASPEKYLIRDLTCLVEEKLGKLNDAQFLLRKTVVEEACHGKKFTIGDYGIKTGDTLVLARIGLVLNINNPQADVCFMVDCTGSMGSWIEAVKSNVKELRDKLCHDYGSCDLRFSFVRYTDYDQPSSTRTTYIQFTRSQPQFHRFVEGIRAYGGGGDGPEDIMGGLRVAFNQLNWRNEAAKVLIHIADYPCHGKQYHNIMDDSFPNGDPAGTSHEEMMSQVVKHNIQYSFGYIEKSTTDQMISIFNASLRNLSKQRLLIRQFDATKPSEVGDAAYRAVSASILAEEVSKKASIRDYTVVKSTPNWSALPTRDGKKTAPIGPASLIDLQQGISIQPPSVPFQFKCAANPFEDGEEGLVFQAYDVRSNRNIVLKQFKYEGEQQNTLDVYLKVLEVHAIASTYAREFSAEKQKPSDVPEIEFIHTDVVESSEAVSKNRYYIFQPYIEGKFEKFNNNQGLVLKSPMSDYLQAFSHYSWIKSGKSLLICDLQGVSSQGKVVLSDPAIHHKGRGGKYGATDRGLVGIEAFFKTHRCNDMCKSLRL